MKSAKEKEKWNRFVAYHLQNPLFIPIIMIIGFIITIIKAIGGKV